MSARRRLTVVLLVLSAMLLLAGCDSGARASFEFTFDSGTGFTQAMELDGLYLSDDQVASVEGVGWKLDKGASGLSAEAEFKDAESYRGPASILYGAVRDAFEDYIGYSPGRALEVAISHTITDYVLAERHDVEIVLPVSAFAPKQCYDCDGVGISDCDECDGGTLTCSDCGGSGGYEGWFGWNSCWSCDGSGEVDCYNCEGSGTIVCYSCDGTGDVPEALRELYSDAVSASRLDVAINMPGIAVAAESGDSGQWRLKGGEIEDTDTFSATSYVINWLYAGIVLAVLLAIFALVIWLVVRRFKKSRALKAAGAAAVAATSAPAAPPVVAATGAEEAPSGKFCSSCGAALGADAKFCRSCGATVGNGES